VAAALKKAQEAYMRFTERCLKLAAAPQVQKNNKIKYDKAKWAYVMFTERCVKLAAATQVQKNK
jgi:hypothetical protein